MCTKLFRVASTVIQTDFYLYIFVSRSVTVVKKGTYANVLLELN